MYWATHHYHELVKLLLDNASLDINSKDNTGYTLLSWAARNDQEALVKLVLEIRNIDINTKDRDDCTSLSHASWMGHKTIVKLLLGLEKWMSILRIIRSYTIILSYNQGP